jgi:hypothetical protein
VSVEEEEKTGAKLPGRARYSSCGLDGSTEDDEFHAVYETRARCCPDEGLDEAFEDFHLKGDAVGERGRQSLPTVLEKQRVKS